MKTTQTAVWLALCLQPSANTEALVDIPFVFGNMAASDDLTLGFDFVQIVRKRLAKHNKSLKINFFLQKMTLM